MLKPKAIPSFQIAAGLGTAIIGVGILAFPRITVEYTKTAAPLTTLLAIILMMLAALVLAYLGNQYPEETIFAYAERLIGKWLSRFFTFLISFYFLVLGSLAAREFGEVVVTSVLQKTPIPVTVLTMLVIATIASRNDIAVFSRILTFYMPFVYLPALIIVVTSLRNASSANLVPLVAGIMETNFGSFITSTLIVAGLFQNFFILGLQIPFMYRPKQAFKSTLIGVGSAGALYLILIYSTLAVFGLEEMKKLLWPTLELAKTAAVPTFYVERMDPVFLAVWVTAVFCAIFAAYYIGVQGLAHVFQFRDHRVISLPVLPVISIIAKLPNNIYALYQIVELVGMSGLILTIGFPLLLLLVHFLRPHTKIPVRSREKLA